jgi:hypothetical protein
MGHKFDQMPMVAQLRLSFIRDNIHNLADDVQAVSSFDELMRIRARFWN